MKKETVCVIDFDDTLAATQAAKRRGHVRLRALGIDTERFAQIDDQWWALLAEGKATYEQIILGRWEEYGLIGSAARLADEIYRDEIQKVHLHSGAKKLLQDLRARNMTIVILTNGALSNQVSRIQGTGIDKMVDAILVSESIGFNKPHVSCFTAAASIVGGHPSDAIMIGDSWINDIQGAIKAGFKGAVWLSKLPQDETGYSNLFLAANLMQVAAQIDRLSASSFSRAA